MKTLFISTSKRKHHRFTDLRLDVMKLYRTEEEMGKHRKGKLLAIGATLTFVACFLLYTLDIEFLSSQTTNLAQAPDPSRLLHGEPTYEVCFTTSPDQAIHHKQFQKHVQFSSRSSTGRR